VHKYNYLTVLGVLFLSGCQTSNICGRDVLKTLNANYDQLIEQTTIVQNGHKTESQAIRVPHEKLICGQLSCITRTEYTWNSVKNAVPINLEYEKKLLRKYLDDMINYTETAKNEQTLCEQQGLRTFYVNQENITKAINQAEFVLN